LLFKIHDTAGFRAGGEEIELEGIERSRLAVKNADLILFIGDIEVGFSSAVEAELINLNPKAKIIKVLNKIDLNHEKSHVEDYRVSAKTSEGMMDFINGLKKKALGENAYSEQDAVVSNIRHFNCLERAKGELAHTIETVEQGISGEFIAADLRTAELALGEIIGIVTPDDVLNNIFSKFCIGK